MPATAPPRRAELLRSGVPLLVIVSACAGSLATRSDYFPALTAHYQGDVKAALAAHPSSEADTFIVTLERAYLSLLSGGSDIDALAAYAEALDDRVRYQVSRELVSFFFLETPEGYYASEHEIVWMHLVLAWGWARRGDSTAAAVEARRASQLLTYEWSAEGHFDDPLLRVLLAAIWTMCGEWDEARVDLRRAALLDPSLTWASQLAERDSRPASFIVILGGVGPEPSWDAAIALNPVRGARRVRFEPKGRGSPAALIDAAGGGLALHLTPRSDPWYDRHLARESELHEAIADSAYLHRSVAAGGAAGAEIVAGVVWGVVSGALILAAGTGIAALGVYGDSGEVAGLGAATARGACPGAGARARPRPRPRRPAQKLAQPPARRHRSAGPLRGRLERSAPPVALVRRHLAGDRRPPLLLRSRPGPGHRGLAHRRLQRQSASGARRRQPPRRARSVGPLALLRRVARSARRDDRARHRGGGGELAGLLAPGLRRPSSTSTSPAGRPRRTGSDSTGRACACSRGPSSWRCRAVTASGEHDAVAVVGQAVVGARYLSSVTNRPVPTS